MITHVSVASENAFVLPIHGITPKESLLLRSVTGLNPPDVDLFIGDYARDGGYYHGRRVGKRNIVLTIDLNPNPALGETVQGWRDFLYKAFFDPQIEGDYLRLNLYDDLGRELYVVGYVDKFDDDMFSENTTVMISMICPDPYIRQAGFTTLWNGSGWITVPFNYHGSAEVGFEVELPILSSTSQLVLSNNSKSITVTYPFVPGNTVYVNTNRGARDILMANSVEVEARSSMTVVDRWKELESGGFTTSLISGLSSSSRWIELHSQNNSMNVHGHEANDGRVVIQTLAYQESYWGV